MFKLLLITNKYYYVYNVVYVNLHYHKTKNTSINKGNIVNMKSKQPIIIAISNHKGGVGKTTSTLNIGAALAKLKKSVLLIDLDPQSHLSDSVGIEEPELSVYDLLKGSKVPPIEISKNLDLIPSSIDLSGADVELANEIGRELLLKKKIAKLEKVYDFILIDCPPALNVLTVNAFVAASEVYIPLQAEYLAFKGLSRLVDIIEKVQESLNPDLSISGVFVTRYDSRKILNKQIVDISQQHFENKFFKTKIRENIAVAEAPSQSMDIFAYAPSSNGAKDYLNLGKEILKKHK